MSKREIATIALRVLGVYIIVISFEELRYIVSAIGVFLDRFVDMVSIKYLGKSINQTVSTGNVIYPNALSSSLPFFIKLGLGLGLLKSARKVASIVVPADEERSLTMHFGARELQSAAFSFVGLLMLMQIGPPFIFDVTNRILGLVFWSKPVILADTWAQNYGAVYSWIQALQVLFCLHLLGVRGLIQLTRGGRIMLRFEKTEDVGEVVSQAHTSPENRM